MIRIQYYNVSNYQVILVILFVVVEEISELQLDLAMVYLKNVGPLFWRRDQVVHDEVVEHEIHQTGRKRFFVGLCCIRDTIPEIKMQSVRKKVHLNWNVMKTNWLYTYILDPHEEFHLYLAVRSTFRTSLSA